MPAQVKGKLLGAPEAAQRLQVSRKFVASLCEAGTFPNAFKLGDGKTSPWKIPEAELDNYLKERIQKQRARAAVVQAR